MRSILKSVLLIFLTSSLMFCGCSDAKTTALHSFETHVKRIAAGFPALSAKLKELTFDADSMKYDVEETKSLVSPFTGKLIFIGKLKMDFAPVNLEMKNEVLYALQDGKWNLQSHSTTPVKFSAIEGANVDSHVVEEMNKTLDQKTKDVTAVESDLSKLLRGD